MSHIIDLDHVSVTFGDLHAVSDVTIKVDKGDVYGVVGYSGAGKSTLVRTINLLQLPTSGTIEVAGTTFFKDGAAQISGKEAEHWDDFPTL